MSLHYFFIGDNLFIYYQRINLSNGRLMEQGIESDVPRTLEAAQEYLKNLAEEADKQGKGTLIDAVSVSIWSNKKVSFRKVEA